MKSDPIICVECGCDEATDGYDVCSDCLEQQPLPLPEDWNVGWCEHCLTSLLWTPAEANTYEGMSHADTILWAWVQGHPEPCSPAVDDPFSDLDVARRG